MIFEVPSVAHEKAMEKIARAYVDMLREGSS
jgi:hypothetical protein